MSISKLYLIVLLGALGCTSTARDLTTTNDKHVNVKGHSTGGDAADSKIDASVGTLGRGTPGARGTPGTRTGPGAPGTPCSRGTRTALTAPTIPGGGTPGTGCSSG